MSKFGFIAAHVYCNFLMTYVYLNILDCKRMVRFVSQADSLRILMVLVLVCNVVGMCLMMKRHRTWFVVILHMLMPYGICTMLSYARERTGLIAGGLIIAVLLAAVYGFLIFRQKIKNKARRKTIILRRIAKVGAGLHCCLGTTLAVFAILCFIRVLSPQIDIPASVSATYKVNYTDEEYKEAEQEFMKLAESRWNVLTLREKLDVLQVVANLEQAYLGIPQTLTVVAEDMSAWTCGYYEDYEWKIHINREHLEEGTPESALDTLCHEAYHAYQKRQVEIYCRLDEKTRNMLMYRKAEIYFEEFFLYVDATEDFEGYYNRETEKDARAYAAERVNVYYNILETKQAERKE